MCACVCVCIHRETSSKYYMEYAWIFMPAYLSGTRVAPRNRSQFPKGYGLPGYKMRQIYWVGVVLYIELIHLQYNATRATQNAKQTSI